MTGYRLVYADGVGVAVDENRPVEPFGILIVITLEPSGA
jgi:hypothetical protein